MVRPWQWTSGTTTYPLDPIKKYTGGDISSDRSYSVEVKKGTFDLTDGSLESGTSPVNMLVGASLVEQFTAAKGVYTVWLDNTFDLIVPNPPWDARQDYTEFTFTIVVATRSGGTWDPMYHPRGNFVVDIDVGAVMTAVVGQVSSVYLAGNQMVAVWKCLGLLQNYGTIRVGVHWDWTWNSAWDKTIEYFTTITTHLTTVANQIQFTLTGESSDTDDQDGDHFIVVSPGIINLLERE